MLAIRCTAMPNPKRNTKLPKKAPRTRRHAETKRMDALRSFHEALKKSEQDEHRFIKELFDRTSDLIEPLDFDIDEE
jgi:hypothetical protein